MKFNRSLNVLSPLLTAAGLFALLTAQKSRKVLTRRLEAASDEDPVTGGANERKFLAEAGRLLRSAGSKNYAVIAFHVRGFRGINEVFGYRNGTRVLHGIHWVFMRHTEKGELSAHVYADRFLLLLSFQDREELCLRIKNICADLKNTIEFYGIHYELSPAFGVCECPEAGTADVRELVNRAVIALKTGRTYEKLPCAFYDEQIRTRQITLKNMADRLSPAMQNREFVVYYQPKYSVAEETLFGAEALVRWRTNPQTLVPPGEFIPEFERTGKIAELDRYVFRQVCSDIRKWMDEGREPAPVSVNLSRVNLLDFSIAEEYRAQAAKFGVPAGLLELEVTESAFAQDGPALEAAMKKLTDAGFSLSIDDFGSDYSSLKMLYDVPAQTLKLDREFLNGLNSGERGRAVVSAVAGLAKKLHMTVVAEGVETEEQLEFLKKIRCAAAQGYYFSPPVPEEQYAALLPAAEKRAAHADFYGNRENSAV
ncbi:hypothetical protein A7X67_09390 [Clostridium sp. W14A]|nr:hypothetical protein A7X67_09390 [Clostridium sp. W14A]